MGSRQYLTVAQIYLQANPLHAHALTVADIVLYIFAHAVPEVVPFVVFAAP